MGISILMIPNPKDAPALAFKSLVAGSLNFNLPFVADTYKDFIPPLIQSGPAWYTAPAPGRNTGAGYNRVVSASYCWPGRRISCSSRRSYPPAALCPFIIFRAPPDLAVTVYQRQRQSSMATEWYRCRFLCGSQRDPTCPTICSGASPHPRWNCSSTNGLLIAFFKCRFIRMLCN